MALNYLLDASVLKRLGDPAVRAAVDRLVEGGIGRASITDLEVGYSARTEAEWDRSHQILASFGRVRTTAHHVTRALEVQRALASKSQRGRSVPDLLVAAAAEQSGLTVLHYDADFDRIAAVTGQSVAWVVPRGSVD